MRRFALASCAAFVLAACNAPALDTTGRIQCTVECPPNYDCRLGHCCPSDTGIECPPGAIGATCMTDGDCVAPQGTTAHCVIGQFLGPFAAPHGYCVATGCTPSNPNPCGAGAICVQGMSETICLRTCDFTTTTSYYNGSCPGTNDTLGCFINFVDQASTNGFCLPDCATDPGVCVAPATCLARLHLCAQPCHNATECPPGQLCGPLTGLPGMFCQNPPM